MGKAEVVLPKLAGGILLRCEQGLTTFLEPMGNQAIYSCVKALVLVNRFACERREKPGDEDRPPARVGFVPKFAAKGDQLDMPPSRSGAKAETLKVSRQTDLP